MLIFKKLSWDDVFSYGKNNYIDFTSSKLVQLVGPNGAGKSSIALILEEILFNKNSRGIKKAGVLNRNSGAKSYKIKLEFEKDGINYTLETIRGSTQKVILTENGIDISCHTSTATYKLIEDIIGYDHKTFTQIVYQSNPFSLEFLSATDTNRKKFLIDLLNLSKYTEIAEAIKIRLKDISTKVDKLNTSIGVIDSYIQRINKEDLSTKDTKPIPIFPSEESDKLAQLKSDLLNIEKINQKIRSNNINKELTLAIPDILMPPTIDIEPVKFERQTITNKIKVLEDIIKNVGPIYKKCPTCGQDVDSSHKVKMVEEAKVQIPVLKNKVTELTATINAWNIDNDKYVKSLSALSEWERRKNLIDNSLPIKELDETIIVSNIATLEGKITNIKKDIDTISKFNASVEAHNAKVSVLSKQLLDNTVEREKLLSELAIEEDLLNTTLILSKTFSPTGFIAYKIESLVEDLENAINEYLSDISNGRFQLSLKVSSSDKLDVIITDNGVDVELCSLSNGQAARVNISTLLAIRKLMQDLSNTKTNLLILDETIEHLDPYGKDKLVEILLKEDHLNIIIVSHGFSHPLLDKIAIEYNNGISRIDNG